VADITRHDRKDPGAVTLQAVVQPTFGAVVKAALTVGSNGRLSIPREVARDVARNSPVVKIACEIDPASIATFKARVHSDGTVERIQGTSAEVLKASIAKDSPSESPENAVGQKTTLGDLWTPVTNGGGNPGFLGKGAPPNKLMNSSAAIPRRAPDGTTGWVPAEAVTLAVGAALVAGAGAK
jgi:hypothetical protein